VKRIRRCASSSSAVWRECNRNFSKERLSLTGGRDVAAGSLAGLFYQRRTNALDI
jgi:hypothetical protein